MNEQELKEKNKKLKKKVTELKKKLGECNKSYDVVKLTRNEEPYELLCTNCGENLKYYLTDTCMYCGAKLSPTKRTNKKYRYTEILQLKAFCDKQGIKCVLTERRNGHKNPSDWDGYKIKFLNGSVIQCKMTNYYLEFDNVSEDLDGKWVELEEAKAFIKSHKEWLDLTYLSEQDDELEGIEE